jgi:two-component system sensor histidine kinase RegB
MTPTLTDALHQLFERWHVLRPRAVYRLSRDNSDPAPRLRWDDALQQAIINLLNNAADTDSGPIDIRASWDNTWVILHVRDRGPGIALELAEQLGKPFVTTKHGKGLGLGLFLSHATIERHGGEIRLFNHPDGGTDAVLRLPIANK